MKKYYLFVFLIIAAMLLNCGCSALQKSNTETLTQAYTEQTFPTTMPETTQVPTEEPNPSVFGQTPQQSDIKLFIDGKMLPSSYIQADTIYLRLEDLEAVLQMNYTEQINPGEDHICRVDMLGHALTFQTTLDTVKDAHTVFTLENVPVFNGESWYLPTDSLLKHLGFSAFEDAQNSTIYYTAYPIADEIPYGKDIPVLMYHAVSDNCWGTSELFVSPSVLDAQIAALLENGYTLINFEDFYRLDEIEKPVMLTFDDGYDDNYDELFPILQKYRVKATIFIIVNDIGKNHKVTEEEIIEMSNSGLVSIQSHTMSHNYLSYMNEEQLEYELYESKLRLTRLTGKEPFVLCYPTGMYSNLSLEITAKYYQFGLLMSTGLYTTGEDDPCMIHRYYVPRGLSAERLLQRIS